MIALNLKIGAEIRKVNIKDELLFNALLVEHREIIKKLITQTDKEYKIDDATFEVVNPFIDFTDDGTSIYPGLIVQTGKKIYAVLFLEGSVPEEDYMISIIKDYVISKYSDLSGDVIVDEFEIDKAAFLAAIRDF